VKLVISTHIKFDSVEAVFNRATEALHRIFGTTDVAAAVSNDHGLRSPASLTLFHKAGHNVLTVVLFLWAGPVHKKV